MAKMAALLWNRVIPLRDHDRVLNIEVGNRLVRGECHLTGATPKGSVHRGRISAGIDVQGIHATSQTPTVDPESNGERCGYVERVVTAAAVDKHGGKTGHGREGNRPPSGLADAAVADRPRRASDAGAIV